MGVRLLPEPANDRSGCQRLCIKGIVGYAWEIHGTSVIRSAKQPSDRRGWRGALEYMRQA